MMKMLLLSRTIRQRVISRTHHLCPQPLATLGTSSYLLTSNVNRQQHQERPQQLQRFSSGTRREFSTSSSSSSADSPRKVVKGDRIYVNLKASDPDSGAVLFSTDGEAVSFVVGQGMVVVGIENRVQGMKVGDRWKETLEPNEAFGLFDATKIRRIEKPKDAMLDPQIQVGAVVQLQTGESGKVLEIQDDAIMVDLNPVLAGKRVTFEVSLERIEEQINNVMSGVDVQTLSPGDGKTFPKTGSRVSVHYTGTLADGGKEFDSSRRVNQRPFSFVLGAGLVIRGWDVGIAKLSLGERAMLYIPSEFGYGSRGAGPIPPNSNLVFDVELVEIDGVAAPKN